MSDAQAVSEPSADSRQQQLRWISSAVLFNALSGVMIGFTNADRFHDGIFQSFPWTRGNCLGSGIWAGHPWSGKAFLVFFVAATLAAVSGYFAVRSTKSVGGPLLFVARVLFWGGLAQLGHWVLAAIANFASSCIA